MTSPARVNMGIASSENLLTPLRSFWVMISALRVPPCRMVSREAVPIAMPIGTAIRSRMPVEINRNAVMR